MSPEILRFFSSSLVAEGAGQPESEKNLDNWQSYEDLPLIELPIAAISTPHTTTPHSPGTTPRFHPSIWSVR